MPLIVALWACATPGDSADTGDSAAAIDPAAPVVESAEITCFRHTTGDRFTQWAGAATVSDPQGLSTIEVLGRVELSDARGDLGTAPLTCADGACTTSWKDDDYDLECDSVAVATYDFAFVVVDQDGHESAALIVHGEKLEE